MAKQSFRELTRGMTVGEKLEYLWEYYKWILLVVPFVIMVAAMVVTGIVNSRTEILYSGTAVNVRLSEEGQNYLTENWAAQLGAQKNQRVDLFITAFEDLKTASDAEVSSAAAIQVVLMITAGDYDYVIMDEVALDFYKNHPVFTPLDTMFSQELMEEYQNSIFTCTTQDGSYAMAIDITDSEFAKAHTSGQRVYIAFPGNTGRTELNDDFLAYIMNIQ